MKTYQRSIRFEQNLADEINRIANTEYRDFTQVVRMLCREALENRYTSLHTDKGDFAQNPHNHIVTMLDSPDREEKIKSGKDIYNGAEKIEYLHSTNNNFYYTVNNFDNFTINNRKVKDIDNGREYPRKETTNNLPH